MTAACRARKLAEAYATTIENTARKAILPQAA
jgi:hypothetical protein